MSGNEDVSEMLTLSIADERESTSKAPFGKLCKQMIDILGDGGILKQVLQCGEGPPIPQNASVLIDYSGFREYGTKPFETTKSNRYPQMMKLGREITLPGLELGLLTMQRGEISRFLFKPQYAYGKMGCPPVVPPACTVLFEVHVIDYLDSEKVDDFIAMSPEGQNTFPLATLLDVVDTLRGFGNRFVYRTRFYIAKDRYKEAVTLLQNRIITCDLEKEKINKALLLLYLNLALTQLRLENPQKALNYCQNALEMDPKNIKALYRSGQAYMELGEYKNAEKYLLRAQAIKPYDSEINNLLKKVRISKIDEIEKEKEIYSKMFPWQDKN